jgi:hypothetical protein
MIAPAIVYAACQTASTRSTTRSGSYGRREREADSAQAAARQGRREVKGAKIFAAKQHLHLECLQGKLQDISHCADTPYPQIAPLA